MSDAYIEIYDEACDRHFACSLPRDLRSWGAPLSRHGVSLRRPYASHRVATADEGWR